MWAIICSSRVVAWECAREVQRRQIPWDGQRRLALEISKAK